ncbi:MAG: glycoside hydrolase family 127 protein [Candidatus Gastranaerophilales bacterium]|nr:glycoside hydrolase family 127 protein [Candidatus Gastranaerophilales bacterium]
MDAEKFSAPPDLFDVRITDAFWGREQELVRREVIPYQWEALNDRVPGADPSFCMHNFKAAGRLMRERRTHKDFVPPAYTFRGFQVLPEEGKAPEEDKFYGFVFQDSDFSKWIEAVGYSLINCPDAALERTADEAIDIVCAAQAPNGYLDTYYIINGMDRIFTNLRDHHELYCFGHLVEGAISYYQATGKDKLLKAALRYGDFVNSVFGPEEGRLQGYPGHEIAEMALARLYELTGEKKYLDLGKFFIDMRGRKPYYFDLEEKERAEHEGRVYREDADPNRYAYHQANQPVREQTEAVGHAVRAVYLYSGMADMARLTRDQELYQACERLWNSIVREKLYITGGIGGTHMGEAFSYPYDLPGDTAYSETCAAIGLVFFARRMLELQANAEYGDVMERALYNTVLAGMALDGKSFFYVNPLEVDPVACAQDGRKAHVKPVRQKWFGCACCPPNIARLVSSLGAYIYTQNPDMLFVHLYVGSRITVKTRNGELAAELKSGFPWQGKVSMTLHLKNAPFRHTLAFRIPAWCDSACVEIWRKDQELVSLHIEGGQLKTTAARLSQEQLAQVLATGQTAPESAEEPKMYLEKGYLYLTGAWQDGDEIALDLKMEVKCLQAHTKVREEIGKVAFVRGPICYCMEEADNGKDLHLCNVDMSALRDIAAEPDETLGHIMYILRVPGERRQTSGEEAALYQPYKPPVRRKTTLTLIPYYAWANRGEGEMRVWIAGG